MSLQSFEENQSTPTISAAPNLSLGFISAAPTSTFSYVRYDEVAALKQETFKVKFEELEALANATLVNGRAKSLFITKLEEAYMWTGKSIRDEQIAKNNAPHQPNRG